MVENGAKLVVMANELLDTTATRVQYLRKRVGLTQKALALRVQTPR